MKRRNAKERHRVLVEPGEGQVGSALARIVETADHLQEVQKWSFSYGDWVFVKTVKSLYLIRVLGGGFYEVSGGWFEKKVLSPARLRISDCIWGGSAINIDLIAACDLRIEFGNRLITSPIQKIFVLPLCIQN